MTDIRVVKSYVEDRGLRKRENARYEGVIVYYRVYDPSHVKVVSKEFINEESAKQWINNGVAVIKNPMNYFKHEMEF